MVFERKSQQYYVVGSDVHRDGMYLEISAEPSGLNAFMEIFYSDITHEMSLTLLKPDVPLDVVEWAISVAKERLPATKSSID